MRMLVLVLLLAALFGGCSETQEASFAGRPVGNVQVLHNLASSRHLARQVLIGNEAVEFLFTGFDSQGAITHGPVSRPTGSEHTLLNVSADTTRLHIDYLEEDGSLHAIADVPLVIQVGQTVTVTAQAQKPSPTVQLINDSGHPDRDVYVLLSANGAIDVKPFPSKAIFPIGTGSDTITSQALTSLIHNRTRTSPYTGKERPVYEFKLNQVVSGRLWISYGEPLQYLKGDIAPDNFAPNIRYDKMELGLGGNTGFYDLTSVDFFAIPLQLEVLADGSDEVPFRTTTFSVSTQTLLEALFDLDQSTMADAFFKINATPANAPTPGWNPTTDELHTFVRVMSPATLVSQAPSKEGDPFSPAPYPSFSSYLADLSNKGVSVALKGSNGVDGLPVTNWDYDTAISGDGDGGFVIACTSNSPMTGRTPPDGSLGDPHYPDDPPLPADLEVEVPLDKQFFDQFIYGVPANSFRVKNLPCHLVPYSKNSVYANIAGDFLAGLNFGYVGGRFGTDGSRWFDVIPGYPPYAQARPNPDDGFYNPYAAVLYNLTDSYSYSISDRLQIGNPLVTTDPSKPYLRITILPDNRLDAPQNVRAVPGDTSMQVSWNAIDTPAAGITHTGYRVIASDGSVKLQDPSGPTSPVELNEIVNNISEPGATTFNVTGLNPNSAYRISVLATGTSNGQPVVSTPGNFALEATTGGPPEFNAPTTMQFGVSTSAVDAPTGTTYTADGRDITGATATLSRPAPSSEGQIVQALFEMKGPNPDLSSSEKEITYSVTNIFFNAFDAGNSVYNAYFNFPFSSSVPASGSGTALLDGSQMIFQYGSVFGPTDQPQPPFGNAANSLVLSVQPNPGNRPKSPAPVRTPASPPIAVNDPGTAPTAPTVDCPTFVVQGVEAAGGTTKLVDLESATVNFVRLVALPSNGGKPAASGSGADASGQIVDKTGKIEFPASAVPYKAPIWKLGYRVDIILNDSQKTTFSAYGSWTKEDGSVGTEWKSGLVGDTSNPDTPGVIYVPLTASPTNQTEWGN